MNGLTNNRKTHIAKGKRKEKQNKGKQGLWKKVLSFSLLFLMLFSAIGPLVVRGSTHSDEFIDNYITNLNNYKNKKIDQLSGMEYIENGQSSEELINNFIYMTKSYLVNDVLDVDNINNISLYLKTEGDDLFSNNALGLRDNFVHMLLSKTVASIDRASVNEEKLAIKEMIEDFRSREDRVFAILAKEYNRKINNVFELDDNDVPILAVEFSTKYENMDECIEDNFDNEVQTLKCINTFQKNRQQTYKDIQKYKGKIQDSVFDSFYLDLSTISRRYCDEIQNPALQTRCYDSYNFNKCYKTFSRFYCDKIKGYEKEIIEENARIMLATVNMDKSYCIPYEEIEKEIDELYDDSIDGERYSIYHICNSSVDVMNVIQYGIRGQDIMDCSDIHEEVMQKNCVELKSDMEKFLVIKQKIRGLLK